MHMFGYFRPMFIPTPYDFLFSHVPLRCVSHEGRAELHLLREPRVRPARQRLDGVPRPAREQRQLRQAAELLWKDAAVVVNGRIVDKIVTRKDVKGFVYQGDRISFRY